MRCFDFCFTVVNLNTTFSFVDFCVSKGGLGLKCKLFLIKIISKILLKFRLITSSQHSKIRVSVLNGFEEYELMQLSRDFAYILNKNINEDVYKELVSRDKENVIIVSNALQFVIEDFMAFKKLNFSVLGSSLIVNNSIISGKYDLYVPDKGKVKVLIDKYPNIIIDEFFTDDFDADYDLVEYSKKSFLIKNGVIEE